MTRKCLGCGKAGHRLESYTSKAALEIKRLRAKLEKTRHKPGSRNNPGRQYRKKGYTKEKARQEYTKKNVGKTYCEKRQNDSVAGWSQFRKRLQKSVSDPMMAYEKLKEFGFLHEPRRFLACGCESLCPPVENSASDVLSVYVQCGRRASLQEQRCVVRCFSRSSFELLWSIASSRKLLWPNVHACSTHSHYGVTVSTSIGRSQNIIDTLSTLEVEAGKKISDSLTCDKGDSEVDATALRKFSARITPTYPNYLPQIQPTPPQPHVVS